MRSKSVPIVNSRSGVNGAPANVMDCKFEHEVFRSKTMNAARVVMVKSVRVKNVYQIVVGKLVPRKHNSPVQANRLQTV